MLLLIFIKNSVFFYATVHAIWIISLNIKKLSVGLVIRPGSVGLVIRPGSVGLVIRSGSVGLVIRPGNRIQLIKEL